MKILVLVISLCLSATAEFSSHDIFSSESRWCHVSDNVVDDYQHALYLFTVDAYRNIGSKAFNHFVFSPLSLWIILASIAEAANPNSKQAMFQFLRLPADPCIRTKYYQLATSRFAVSQDVYISNSRALIIDEGITINPAYHNFVHKNSLLNIMTAPIRSDPQTALQEMRRISSATLPNLNLEGNSVILDAIDYNGLWNTAFEEAVVLRSPFYSKTGEQIGAVDLMKIRRRVRRAYLRSLNVKTIELPVGYNDRYRMIIGIILDNNVARAVRAFKDTVIDEYLSSVQESSIPIDIAIPRFNITSEYDIRKTLEELGIMKLWTDPTMTRSISEPAALPSGFVQRSTITLDTSGLGPPVVHQFLYNNSASWDPVLGQEFMANRPFLFSLFDAETYTCIMAAAFTQPTYKN